MTKHTPTPWELEGEGQKVVGILDTNSGHYIAKLSGWNIKTQDANAIFILRAVNYHDEAKETLRACLDRLTEMGFSIHEVGLPQTISNLLSKMED